MINGHVNLLVNLLTLINKHTIRTIIEHNAVQDTILPFSLGHQSLFRKSAINAFTTIQVSNHIKDSGCIRTAVVLGQH